MTACFFLFRPALDIYCRFCLHCFTLPRIFGSTSGALYRSSWFGHFEWETCLYHKWCGRNDYKNTQFSCSSFSCSVLSPAQTRTHSFRRQALPSLATLLDCSTWSAISASTQNISSISKVFSSVSTRVTCRSIQCERRCFSRNQLTTDTTEP